VRQWPFEGREPELAEIRRAFADPRLAAVLVSAPAGLGKTRVAREALARLRCRTEWITATRAATAIPYGALAHLLPDDLPPSQAIGAVRLVRAIQVRVARWGGRQRVVLGVDDAHLLDDASSTVIAELAATGAAFLVLTVRTGEPLADCLTRLGKEGEAMVLELGGLADPVIDRLIDHSAGAGVNALRRRHLRRAAHGNPLALRELLHGAVPGGLTDLVASRLDALEPATRTVVETVACGEPVPLTFLERLAGPRRVAAAEESGLVVCERSGARVAARLDHPLFGEVLRARMPVARSRQIFRELAGELLATPMRRREDVLRAALWQVEGGRIVRPDVVLAGAREADGRSGLQLAERLARAAREAAPGPEADTLLGHILEYQGRSEEAAALLPDSPPDGLAERVRWAVPRADFLYWARGDLAGAQHAWNTLAGHPVVEGSRAFTLFFAARFDEVLPAAHLVLDRADSDPQGLVWAAAAKIGTMGFLGRLDEAERAHVRGAEIGAAHTATLPWGSLQIEVAACLAYLAGGFPERAAAVAAAGYHTALQTGPPMMVSAWGLFGGLAALAQGRLDDADRLLAEARIGYEANDTFRLLHFIVAAQAGACALRGLDRAARDMMARSDALDNGTNEVFHPWIGAWRAWTAQAGGDSAAALRHATSAAESAAAIGAPGVEALARYDVVRLGGAADLDRMAVLPGPVPAALAAAASGLAAPDGSALLRAATALDGYGYHLHAAELATTGARVLRRTSHRGRAGLAAATAAEMRAKCPGVRTPLLARDEVADLLTARERQIVLLAARHTSKEIAEQLGLALATVNNTLARAYPKLGVTSRDQLRDLLS
jgi:DNA-binding CsgD family transcriptional regulator